MTIAPSNQQLISMLTIFYESNEFSLAFLAFEKGYNSRKNYMLYGAFWQFPFTALSITKHQKHKKKSSCCRIAKKILFYSSFVQQKKKELKFGNLCRLRCFSIVLRFFSFLNCFASETKENPFSIENKIIQLLTHFRPGKCEWVNNTTEAAMVVISIEFNCQMISINVHIICVSNTIIHRHNPFYFIKSRDRRIN